MHANENVTNVYCNLIDSNNVLFNRELTSIGFSYTSTYWRVSYLFDINLEKQIWLAIQYFHNNTNQLYENVVIEFNQSTHEKTIIESNYTSTDSYWNWFISCNKNYAMTLDCAIKAWDYYYIWWNIFKLQWWLLTYQWTYYSSSIEKRLTTIYYTENHFDLNNLQSDAKTIKAIDKVQLNNGVFEFISDSSIEYLLNFDRFNKINFWVWTVNDWYDIYWENEENKPRFILWYNWLKDNNKNQSRLILASRDTSLENTPAFTSSNRPEVSLQWNEATNYTYRIIYWDRFMLREVPYQAGSSRQSQFLNRYRDYKYFYWLGWWYYLIGRIVVTTGTPRRNQMVYDIVYLSENYLSDDDTWTFTDTQAIVLWKWLDSFSAKINWEWLRYNQNYRLYYKLNNADSFTLVSDIKKITKFNTNAYYNANSSNDFYYRIELRQISWQNVKVNKTTLVFYWNVEE